LEDWAASSGMSQLQTSFTGRDGSISDDWPGLIGLGCSIVR
jgi:hypothetical protein